MNAAVSPPPALPALAATLRRAAADLPRDELPALLGELETARALAWVRLAAPAPAPASSKDGTLLDAKGVAERLGVPESWVRDMARQGKIPSIRLGHYVRFRVSDLDAHVSAQRSCLIPDRS